MRKLNIVCDRCRSGRYKTYPGYRKCLHCGNEFPTFSEKEVFQEHNKDSMNYQDSVI
jgi:hypothetical protein